MPSAVARRFPSLVLHKPTGQARLRFRGRDYYFGRYGTPEADSAYLRAKAHFVLTGDLPVDLAQPKRKRNRPVDPPTPAAAVTIEDLILRFWRYAERHYVKNGKPTSELDCLRSALRPLRRMHGHTPVDSFGPVALQAVRVAMIEKGWARKSINKHVSRIRSVFRWGVANELVKPETLTALQAVQGLQAGRTEAHDNPEREPVPSSISKR